MSHAPVVGEPAPGFSLPDTHGTPVSLDGLRGGPVVVVFVPFAFSATCTGELCELRDNIAEFRGADVHLVVVSCDPMFSLRAWAAQEGYEFDLLSDFWPHGDVARAYGVFDEASGHALRGSFLIDGEGVLRWSVVNPRGQARPLAAYREALAAL
ncbi:redoxin domain-containing protein [Cellulomonas sp.]|uniref:redoxin domain-containing protein n=1 Tax=Cellulomonas sp. TaxID=40001 RepID=UPI0025848844|nr:redoxin domain-containing protein [Cellulomonas sp.]MCR6690337.1 redoxin domain-containing protein [Cellulomonas sp.]